MADVKAQWFLFPWWLWFWVVIIDIIVFLILRRLFIIC